MMKAQNDGKQMKYVWAFAPPNKAEKTFGKHSANIRHKNTRLA